MTKEELCYDELLLVEVIKHEVRESDVSYKNIMEETQLSRPAVSRLLNAKNMAIVRHYLQIRELLKLLKIDDRI